MIFMTITLQHQLTNFSTDERENKVDESEERCVRKEKLRKRVRVTLGLEKAMKRKQKMVNTKV